MFRRNRFLKVTPDKNDYQNYGNRVSDPGLKDRLEKIINNSFVQLHNKTVEFLQSLKEQYEKRGSLSHNQIRILEDIEKKYSEENVSAELQAKQNWISSYDSTKQETFRKIAKWYHDSWAEGRQPYYYRDVFEKVLNEQSYVPPQSLYEKIVNNKFVQGYLNNLQKEPKFKQGEVVSFTEPAKKSLYAFYKDLPGGIIVEITDIAGHANGTRCYKVLLIGSDEVLNVQERYLKRGK